MSLADRRALVARLQVDQKAAVVQRRVGAVDADERGQAGDVGILQNGVGKRLLPLGHRRERNRWRGHRNPLDQAGVLNREKTLWDHDVEKHRQHQGGGRDQQGQRLMVEHPVQQPAIFGDQPVEPFLALARDKRHLGGPLMAQDPGAHHRHQGQRHHRRDDDRHRQGDRELAEQPADDVGHEQQRDQHRDQRDRQRDDRKADLRGAFERRLQSADRRPRCSARCSRS